MLAPCMVLRRCGVGVRHTCPAMARALLQCSPHDCIVCRVSSHLAVSVLDMLCVCGREGEEGAGARCCHQAVHVWTMLQAAAGAAAAGHLDAAYAFTLVHRGISSTKAHAASFMSGLRPHRYRCFLFVLNSGQQPGGGLSSSRYVALRYVEALMAAYACSLGWSMAGVAGHLPTVGCRICASCRLVPAVVQYLSCGYASRTRR